MKRHAVAVTNAANVVVNNVVIVAVEIVVRRYSGLQGSCSITSSHTTTINNNSLQTPLSPIEIATTVIFSYHNQEQSTIGSLVSTSLMNCYNNNMSLLDFRNTWRKHLRHRKRNKSNFQLLQAAILRSLSTIYATNPNNNDTTSPFWWLLTHLKMLILAPTTTAQTNNTIQPTISD